MDIKEVEKEYCSRCPSYKYGCGFITRELQDKCVQLSDYVDGYEKGYEQAEKDLGLTWEDMFNIFCLVNEVLDDYAEGKTKKEVGEEVLRRFKAKKNNTTSK